MSLCYGENDFDKYKETPQNMNIFTLHDRNIYRDTNENQKSLTARKKYQNNLRRKMVKMVKTKRLSTQIEKW